MLLNQQYQYVVCKNVILYKKALVVFMYTEYKYTHRPLY